MAGLTIRPLTNRFGAEITGIDTSEPLAPILRDAIVDAFITIRRWSCAARC